MKKLISLAFALLMVTSFAVAQTSNDGKKDARIERLIQKLDAVVDLTDHQETKLRADINVVFDELITIKNSGDAAAYTSAKQKARLRIRRKIRDHLTPDQIQRYENYRSAKK